MIYDDYIQYCIDYEKIYGKETVILMEVGGFFELYGVDYNNNKSGADIYKVASLLGIQVSRKNKNIIENSNTNPLMAGFPSYTLNKFIDILVTNNKTVVLVEQVTPPPNPKRDVTRIISPATYDEKIFQNDTTNYMMHVYIQPYDKSLAFGISCIDISTGKTYVEEIHNIQDINICLQELCKIGIYIQPKELIISSHDQITTDQHECISKLFPNIKQYNKTNCLTHDCIRPVFQEHVFQQFYRNESQLSIFEFLDLERKLLGSISFAYLLKFIENHNPSNVLNFMKPIALENNSCLKITHNAPEQLNITTGEISLLDILNNSITSIGKRYFRYRLMNPTSDATKISLSYQDIQLFENYDIEVIRATLKNVKDIEKIFHKQAKKVFPYDVLNIYKSIKSMIKIADTIDHKHEFHKILDYLESEFNFSDENLFNTLDEKILKNITEAYKYRSIIDENIKAFQSFIDSFPEQMNSEHFKVENNDREGYHIVCTSKRFEQYKKSYPDIFKNCVFSNNKTTTKIFMSGEKKINNSIIEATQMLQKLIHTKYYDIIDHLKSHYSDSCYNIVNFIEYVDFNTTNVHNNILLKLYKATIDQSKSSGSIEAKSLRHPIIEYISKDIQYVSNDITLDENGMILYGINASGKSSLMKSVGIAIIMAQAGMYVPASSFMFTPYTAIFTRITGNDNIYRNQSTFVLEMSELRTIMKCADSRSIVIGDELCSGTETISAVSIVSSAIKFLSNKKISFIFATHLHELVNFIADTTAKTYHLSVSYEDGKIIYDRNLKEGIGNTLYGLEVCRSLDMDEEFMNMAFNIRNNYSQKKDSIPMNSKYNSNILKDKCQICDSMDSIDIHHIHEQHDADTRGNFDSFHKDDEHNLVKLCKNCHNDVHHNKIVISGYKSTTNGRELHYHFNKVFAYDDPEVIQTVINTKKANNMSQTVKILSERYNINFTTYRINKILNGNAFK